MIPIHAPTQNLWGVRVKDSSNVTAAVWEPPRLSAVHLTAENNPSGQGVTALWQTLQGKSKIGEEGEFAD